MILMIYLSFVRHINTKWKNLVCACLEMCELKVAFMFPALKFPCAFCFSFMKKVIRSHTTILVKFGNIQIR